MELTQYPIYRKDSCHFFKETSDDQCVCIFKGGKFGYGIYSAHRELGIDGSVESNEIEFLDAYDFVSNKLDEISL